MIEDSKLVLVLCSLVGAKNQKVVPLQTKEWNDLYLKLQEKNYNLKDLIDLSPQIIEDLELDDIMVNRINKLIGRSSALSFEITKYEKMGIHYITILDDNYPKVLKEKLKNNCPPIMYYCGNLDNLKKGYIGFVGSREISSDDIKTTDILVQISIRNGFGIVSGGAKGIDSESVKTCLNNNGYVLEILADSMLKKIKDKDYITKIREGFLLAISFVSPEAGFDVGNAMMRNKFIYLFSVGTIVVKSSYNKGGTWAGAIENIKKGYSPICVYNNNEDGNKELINMGAKPIDLNWDGVFDEIIPVIEKKKKNIINNLQLSLF